MENGNINTKFRNKFGKSKPIKTEFDDSVKYAQNLTPGQNVASENSYPINRNSGFDGSPMPSNGISNDSHVFEQYITNFKSRLTEIWEPPNGSEFPILGSGSIEKLDNSSKITTVNKLVPKKRKFLDKN